MNNMLKKKTIRKDKRTKRVRKNLHGESLKPRLCVTKTNIHIYAQLIDDRAGVTIASTSTLAKEFRETEFNKKNCKTARQIGVRIAEIAKKKNIEKAIFDRGSFKYHGVLAEVAEGARSAGLQI